MKISAQKKEKIVQILENFLSRVYKLIELPMDEVVVNPFLSAALRLESKAEIIDFFLTQRLQRSIVTSFGSVIQEIAKTLDSEAREEDIDLVFVREGKKYYVQLKSGPEGFTRPALRKTKAAFQRVKTREPSCITVIGFSYGTKAQLSPVWGREAYESADRVLVGKEFWDFFAGEEFYEELITLIRSFRPRRGRSSGHLPRMKFKQLHKRIYRRLLAAS